MTPFLTAWEVILCFTLFIEKDSIYREKLLFQPGSVKARKTLGKTICRHYLQAVIFHDVYMESSIKG